jgi:DNA-binding transcriptional LysR family regulator
MDVALLQTFVAVARCGSVHRAATELHLSQASVSRQLQRLETTLGADLFIRQEGRPLELSPAGRRLLDGSQELIDDVGQRWASLRALATEDRRLAIGLSSLVLQVAETGPMLQAFRDANPDLDLSITEHHAYEGALAQLEAGGSDVCLSGLEIAVIAPPLEAHLLWPMEARVGVSRAHPLADRERLTLADLDGVPLTILEGTLAGDVLVAECARAGIRPAIRERSTQVSTLAMALLSGELATVAFGVDRREVPPPFEDLVSIPLEMEIPPYRLAVFWRGDRPLTAAAERFIEHVRATYAASVPLPIQD